MNGRHLRARIENRERWIKAAHRAFEERVQICQVQSTGQWIATSGSQFGLAYEVEITGNIAHGCDCMAGLNGDPVCKHRAAFYLLIGALTADPEPDRPDLAVTTAAWLIDCADCDGRGDLAGNRCAACIGAGIVEIPSLPAAA